MFFIVTSQYHLDRSKFCLTFGFQTLYDVEVSLGAGMAGQGMGWKRFAYAVTAQYFSELCSPRILDSASDPCCLTILLYTPISKNGAAHWPTNSAP